MKFKQSTLINRLLLYIAIFLVINLLANRSFFRLDFTADSRYTLSNSTKDILESLEDPITVTAYFTDNLPAQLKSVERDFKDLLSEYRVKSGDNVVYSFVDPGDDEALRNEIAQAGVFPLQIQAREKDKAVQVQSFAGAVLKAGNRQEVLPAIVQMAGTEYALSSAIKKLSVTSKPKVGFIQGHGEPGLDRLPEVMRELINLYEVDTVNLAAGPSAWSEFKTLVLLGPNAPIPPGELQQLDVFLESGGRLFVGINAVNGDLTRQGPWDRVNTGLETWLTSKGIMVEQSFLLDTQSDEIPIPQGIFMVPYKFFYFPRISNFTDHPISQGLEDASFHFASPIIITNADSSLSIQPLATTSAQSGKQPPPVFFSLQKQWTEADFPYGTQNIAVTVEKKKEAGNEPQMVVIGDGDFPMVMPHQNQQQGGRGLPANNVNLFVNSVDWLTDDTGLIDLRTKRVENRPLEKMMGDDNQTSRTVFKIFNFLLPLLIVIVVGIVRSQQRKAQSRRWKAENYG